jgi:hypothetical protein
VEGHVQGITAPEGQEDSPVPLHHPADGPPPYSGEDTQSPQRNIHRPSLIAHGSGPLSPGPSPPKGGEGSLAGAEIKAKAGLNSSPTGGGGPSQTVEGHVQGITAPEGQDNQSVPLPHASHGPPPHSGEDLQPPPVAPAQAGAYRACRSRQTHVMGTSLRWCDGVF